MGEQGVGYKELRDGCEHTGFPPQCFLSSDQLFPDDFLKPANISLLERIDRLDLFLSVMEDKALPESRGNSSRHLISRTPSSLEKRCKTTESVLEEVEEKGTIVERVSELEERLTKLQRMMKTKSRDETASRRSAMEAGAPAPRGDQAFLSRQRSGPHECDHYHEQSPHEPIDVDKHEVPIVSKASLEDNQQDKAFADPENIDMSPRKQECSQRNGNLDQQRAGSSEGTPMAEEDAKAQRHQLKKKSRTLKKWITKRLHIGSTVRQVNARRANILT